MRRFLGNYLFIYLFIIYLFIYLFKQYLLITFAANGNYWVDLETLQANLGPNEIIGFQNLEESRQKSAML